MMRFGRPGRWLTAVCLFAAPTLAGCGFTPLYATPGVSGGLSHIDVVAPQGRVAFLLRQDLDDALAHEQAAPAQWRLEFNVEQTRSPKGLGVTNVAERYDVGLTVTYSLVSVATGKIEHTGKVISQVSYDQANAPYAGIIAREDSQERAASDAARRIQIELAAWLARHPHS